ncbi:hypothetical protein [Streptomyces sp. NPDC047976]|uniref:hypothetical protein n=1 Tax=Streptomyces sp. NPDC047976 TaxID=3155746 RepID=UPI00343A8A51
MINPTSVDIEEFLTAWFGPPKSVTEPVKNSPIPLPDGLITWLSLAAKWRIPASGVKVLSQPHEMLEEEGKYIFMGDHGGWAWAFDPSTSEPVYEAKDDEAWRPLRASWQETFFQYALTEAIESAPITTWCSDISESGRNAALAGFDEVVFTDGQWPGPGWRWFMADDLIAYSGPKRSMPGRFTVTIGAKASGSTKQLNPDSDHDWRVRENR